MKTAERLNHDQFDLLCRAADIDGAATLQELSEVLDGENLIQRASKEMHYLMLLSFVAKQGELYSITEQGRAALA